MGRKEMSRFLITMFLFFAMAVSANAAGQDTEQLTPQSVAPPFGVTWHLTADDTTTAFDTITVDDSYGLNWLESVCVSFPYTTDPDALVVTVKNAQGVEVLVSGSLSSGDCLSAETAATKKHPTLVPVAGGFTIELTTNTTASAELNLTVNGF